MHPDACAVVPPQTRSLHPAPCILHPEPFNLKSRTAAPRRRGAPHQTLDTPNLIPLTQFPAPQTLPKVLEQTRFEFLVHGQWCATLALSRSIWAHQFGASGLFSAPKLTDLYRGPSMST
ncbi:hypothetical protein T484DRAFT_1962070 [Baffinella frigidus]|nr:hypothetical protein T484DRAFT_1962070 [Cryptophyta sp. CCMP2293]